MTLPPLKLVLTAVGCPGASTLVRMLKANGEREISIHGVDMRADAIGRFLCDGFDLVPAGASPGFIPALAAVVERVRPDLLFVQSSHEIEVVARHRGVFEALGAKVLADGVNGIETAGDKALMHAACSQIAVPQPGLLLPRSLGEFVAGARELGYPDVPVCFKPPVAKGSRGFRILSAEVDRVHELLHERPINRYMTLPELESLFRGVEPFPRLMLMEYVDAPEITVDLFADKGEMVFHQTRTREEFLTGLAMAFKTIDRPDLVELSRQVVRHLQLDYFQSIQWIGGKLLEINPRVSTFVYQEDFIIPYLGIKYALGELDAAGVALAQSRVRFSRRSVRYYDQVFWDE
ncbi:MAG: ATP-grasp domain-containing protein [Actinobacteria bacterium]|nr:ATP-grasp domain-containing protein [Actinomycetota bacterium]